MKRYDNIMQDNTIAPKPDNNIWLKDHKLYYFTNGKWQMIGADIDYSQINNLQEEINKANTELKKKANTSDIPDVSKFFDDAQYEDSKIYFLNNGKRLAYIDASDFILDKAIDDVEIQGEELVITWNVDAGSKVVRIPLSKIFNPNNYYTKEAIDAFLEAIKEEVSKIAKQASYKIVEELPETPEAEDINKIFIVRNSEYIEPFYTTGSVEGGLKVSVTLPVDDEHKSIIKPGMVLIVPESDSYAEDGRTPTPGIPLKLYCTGTDTITGYPVVRTLNGIKNKPSDPFSMVPNISTGAKVEMFPNDNSCIEYIWNTDKWEKLGESNNWYKGANINSVQMTSCKATGIESVAEGSHTQAIGDFSHAEGYNSVASGTDSHTEGENTKAVGRASHAGGSGVEALNDYEFSTGVNNRSNKNSTTFGDSQNTLFSIGNGTVYTNHNAFELRQNGDMYIADTSEAAANNYTPMIHLQEKLNSIPPVNLLTESSFEIPVSALGSETITLGTIKVNENPITYWPADGETYTLHAKITSPTGVNNIIVAINGSTITMLPASGTDVNVTFVIDEQFKGEQTLTLTASGRDANSTGTPVKLTNVTLVRGKEPLKITLEEVNNTSIKSFFVAGNYVKPDPDNGAVTFGWGEGITVTPDKNWPGAEQYSQVIIGIDTSKIATNQSVTETFNSFNEKYSKEIVRFGKEISKIERIEKVADDSEVIKKVWISDNNTYVLPTTGMITFTGEEGIIIRDNPDDGDRIIIQVNTNHIATRKYVDSIKTSILGSEALNESYDTLQEVAEWIESHSGEAVEIISKQNELIGWKESLEREENSDKNKFMCRLPAKFTDDGHSTLGANYWTCNITTGERAANTFALDYASTTKAGAMSASDKVKLNSLNVVSQDIEEGYTPRTDEQSRSVKLTDADGGKVMFPVTLVDNVYTEDDESLEEILNNKADKSDVPNIKIEKIAEIADVDFNKVTREELKKDLFIDLWKTAVDKDGGYNEETGFFELNGLTDITYEEALVIYNACPKGILESFNYIYDKGLYSNSVPLCRTFIIPLRSDRGGGWCPTVQAFRKQSKLERLDVKRYNTYSGYGKTAFQEGFKNCTTLVSVSIIFNCRHTSEEGLVDMFAGCSNLETIYISGLRVNFSVKDSPNLSYDSLNYLITNSTNAEADTPITVTVHSEVYEKLSNEWSDLNELAISKQITFATA